MTAFLVHPSITLQQSSEIDHFFQALRSELEQHVPVIIIGNNMLLRSAVISHEDALIVFNGFAQDYCEDLLVLLADAKAAKSEIVPVAINESTRQPPTVICENQSFDVQEYLKNRCLSRDYIKLPAIGLARMIVSRIQPTLSTDTMHLFLSYRRFDGEEIARSFHQQLQQRFERGFRDLIDINIGEDAQETIESNLRKSDAVIFLDTPRSGESPWIARELVMALSLNIPIIWIQFGTQNDRTKLPIQPADQPHFSFTEIALNEELAPTLADQIIRKTFDILREHASGVFNDLRRIKSLREKEVIFVEKDKKHMLYEVQIPRPSFRYPQKPISHLIQFYGRRPQNKDCEILLERAQSLGCQPEQYDATILLSIASRQSPECKDCFYIDSSSEYVAMLENYFTTNKEIKRNKGIIISGAFPDCEPQYQQYITTAVHSFAKVIFDRGGIVIFGGHPTFQHLIFDMAQRRTNDVIEATHLYVSEFFVGPGATQEFKKKANTVVTGNIDNDRAKSLTAMRKAMITDNQALGMVVIGGKTTSGGHSPGIDEEIELAKRAGLPIFLIGSVGGRSSQIALEFDKLNWKESINGLSIQHNKELLISTDYTSLANKILNSVGL